MLTTIREWENSFVPINRIPVDVLSLIPTHLNQQKDCFRASFVCRHWRRTFIQRAELWSRLFLSKGSLYTTTLLGRAKGSALDITVRFLDEPVSTLMAISSRSKQIKSLTLSSNIQEFSEAVPGPYPLLHTLTINIMDGPRVLAPPCPPLFSNAVNLKVFRYHSTWPPLLSPFVFPNLLLFDFQAEPMVDLSVSQLLDFLEGSPMLQVVRMKIFTDLYLGDVPQERVVILPNVKDLDLTVSDSGPSYPIAAHLSCPSARLTSIKHETDYNFMTTEDIFPPLVPWTAIVHQHTRSSVEEVTLEITTDEDTKCRLAFRSLDGAVIEIFSKVTVGDEDEDDEDEDSMAHERVYRQLFAEATGTIRNHPQLANIKCLRIHHNPLLIGPNEISHMAREVARLLETLGPLEELAIQCELRPYLDPFLTWPTVEEGVAFPQIKNLTLSHPVTLVGQEWKGTLVEFARSQRAQGVPFECVTIRSSRMPAWIEEELSPWVGSVKYCYSRLKGWDF